MNFFFYISFYFLLLTSIIGYGYFFANFFSKKNESNLGYIGLYGIFLLILISYVSNFFIAHSLHFNSLILLFGLGSFFLFIFKNYKNEKKNIALLFFLFFLLIPFILTAKNHDDFPYYHFSYIHLLTNSQASLGIGIFNHGFRTPSSIFYFASLFYLPKIGYELIHVAPVFFVGFINFIFLKKIFRIIGQKENVYILLLSILSLVIINIFFSRMAEHGTDRSAQILILLMVTEILQIINSKNSNQSLKIDRFLILLVLAVSLKAFYLIYLIFILIIFYYQKIKISFLLDLLKNKISYLCLLLLFLLLMVNVFNTGCLIYPMSITCIPSLAWSIPVEEVNHMNQWYQQWSKGGAAPNFRVENPEQYIKYFNWVPNWINIYFFNKVSDYLLGLLFLIVVMTITFRQNFNNIKIERRFVFVCILLFFLFLEWFYFHPALRYGGYHLIALLIFIPFSVYLENKFVLSNSSIFKIKFLIIIIFTIFLIKNITRINQQHKQYNYNFISYPSYNLEFQNFDIYKGIEKIKKEGRRINNFYGYNIYTR